MTVGALIVVDEVLEVADAAEIPTNATKSDESANAVNTLLIAFVFMTFFPYLGSWQFAFIYFLHQSHHCSKVRQRAIRRLS
jgi:Kef-type K+ transport system membrane component KefB